MRSANPLRFMLVCGILFYSGCAAFHTVRQVADFERPAEYERFFELLDRTVKEAGVRNASDFAVAGFPYLRSNRFLAGLKPDLNNEARRRQWVRWMQALDLAARRKEIQNLIMQRSKRNALGVPRPTLADQQILLAMLAPVFYQDVAAAYDRIGEVVWQNDTVSINPAKPTLYYYLSHARLKGEPILQLNYVLWYSARNGPLSPWIEKGPLDGLTVRISLDPQGQPFMVDIMNNCGCYHFYLSHPQKSAKIIPASGGIDAFAPRRLPPSYPEQRLGLRIMSGWHQVHHLAADSTPISYAPYQLVDYDRLEMLPRADHMFESIFNSKGIAKDSPRIESLVFFPMGIADIGSMRQRGHHAVVFIGRAHFDDPHLFDQNFEFE